VTENHGLVDKRQHEGKDSGKPTEERRMEKTKTEKVFDSKRWSPTSLKCLREGKKKMRGGGERREKR